MNEGFMLFIYNQTNNFPLKGKFVCHESHSPVLLIYPYNVIKPK